MPLADSDPGFVQYHVDFVMGFIIVGDKECSTVDVIHVIRYPSFKKNIGDMVRLQEICVPVLINMCVRGDKKYVSYVPYVLSELEVPSNIL